MRATFGTDSKRLLAPLCARVWDVISTFADRGGSQYIQGLLSSVCLVVPPRAMDRVGSHSKLLARNILCHARRTLCSASSSRPSALSGVEASISHPRQMCKRADCASVLGSHWTFGMSAELCAMPCVPGRGRERRNHLKTVFPARLVQTGWASDHRSQTKCMNATMP